jgi:hypothetical protein
MRRILLFLPVFVLGIPPALAQDQAKGQDKPSSLQDQVKAIEQDFRKGVQAHGRFTDIDDLLKFATPFTKRALDIAEKNAKDPAAFDALLFVVRDAGGIYNDPIGDKTVDLFLRDHLQNPRIGEICPPLGNDDNPLAEKLLRAIMEKNPMRENQGQACFNLGVYFMNRARASDSAADKKKKQESAVKAFEETSAKYGDVKGPGGRTLGEAAKTQLQALKTEEKAAKADERLSAGKAAPDIEGADLDGKEFKLSDYRGKVVMLDFWGHW